MAKASRKPEEWKKENVEWRMEMFDGRKDLASASSFRAAESMVFSPRRVSLDFFDSFLSRKKNILK